MGSNTDAKEILEKHKKLVWPILNNYLKTPNLPSNFKIKDKYKEFDKRHWEIASDYPKRKGKYFRPTILILMAQAMGATQSKTLLTAAAMQLSEEWILIHDDIEDDSIERRGSPTLHLKYGAGLAINAGDALHLTNWKILFDNESLVGKKTSGRIIDEFHLMLSRTVLGQTTEIAMIRDNITSYTDQDWYFIADGKTSYYTVSGPLRLGAIIASATSKQLRTISEFGINLGRCFQIIDDILDITSNFAGLKKQLGNDIYEGKRTLILGHLLRNANSTDKKKIITILKKPRERKTPGEVRWVIKSMNKYDSIDYAKDKAAFFRNKAQEIFDKQMSFVKSPHREKLETLMQFVLERDH